MPDKGSALYVPLRSNAKTLVTGMPIASLRRRLKYASVFYDALFLESGILRMQAGEGGSSSFMVPATSDSPAQWQTPRQRQLAQHAPFQLAIGREITPGVPAETTRPFLASDSAVAWTATLLPFADELPASTDWIHFGKFSDPTPPIDRIARDWTWADERNPYLEQAIPGRFVRGAVIKNANQDLAITTAAGCSVTMDSLHSQVVAQRFGDEAGWKWQGYAIPFLFPQVGNWTWEEIAHLRRDPNMARFRGVLREIEEEAAVEVNGGDLEAAVRHAYERHSAKAIPQLTGYTWAAAATVVGYVISCGSDLATFGLKGLAANLVSAAVGSAPGAAMGIRAVSRQRKSRGWVTVRNRIIGVTS